MAPVDTANRHGAPRPVPQGRPAPSTGAAAEGSTSQRRNEESWVEIASQPSSSSLSSMGDEIVTTGLRVGNNAYHPRRRRLHQPPQPQPASMPPSYVIGHAAAQAGTSSQEEYDETESEEDRLLTSSTEQVHPLANHPPRQPTAIPVTVDSDAESSSSENATALGRPSGGSGPTFRPQPNAFSHQPSHRHSTSSARPSLRHSSSSRPPRDFQADNDAALRASLTTLLSCAAAARGLPRKDHHPAAAAGLRPASSQPMELRLVPESELMAADPSPPAAAPPKVPAQRTASNSSAPSAPTSETSKRAGAPQQGKSPRATKKKRTAADAETTTTTLISPTLLTWVVSAGVVVIFSVVGFGAGYVIGREVGRQEGGVALLPGGGGAGNASCGRELARSGTGTLRRLRWGSVGKTIVA